MNPFFPELKRKFGFGCMRFPMCDEQVDAQEVAKMVDAFLAAGFAYFDTAKPYHNGASQDIVRQCLTSRYPREAYILTNKLSPTCFETEAEILPLFESQLADCGVDYFDFYLFHANSAQRHEKFTRTHAYDLVQGLKAQGKIRHVGMSFHDSAEVLDKILTDRPEIEVVQLQFNYVDYDDPRVQSRACYEVCRKHNKPVLVMEPVKGGSLINLPEAAMELLDGKSPAEYAIRFAASFENVVMVLSGMSSMEQLQENTAFMRDFQPLSEQELETVTKLRTLYQAQHRIPCTACRYCTDGCPAGLDIPTLFSCLNDKREDKPEAKRYYDLPVRADSCVGCGQCEQACPQHLHIRQLLHAVDEAFSA